MQGKGKACCAAPGPRWGVHLHFYIHWACRWIDHWVHDAWQCDTRPMFIFPAARHHLPLAGIKLYCLVNRDKCVNNLPKVVTWQCCRLESFRGPFGHQSGSLLLYHQAVPRLYFKQLYIISTLMHYAVYKKKLCSSVFSCENHTVMLHSACYRSHVVYFCFRCESWSGESYSGK